MSPFRLFGQADDTPRTADGPVGWAPDLWPADPAPATRHARPRPFDREDDPPTDPFGFPPVVMPPLDPLEAAAVAGAFAADYLSWDEADPARRGRALADHLAATAGDPGLLGWDGRGRQRAEFALPGRVVADGDGRVLVDVRVRVTPYRAVGEREPDGPAVEPEPQVPGVPAAAPAPDGRGWLGCASYWVRLSVPVVRDADRLVVDAVADGAPSAAPVAESAPETGLLRIPGSAW